jgi:hypothetical protein
MPQDGHVTQDGERTAGKRWRAKQAKQRAPPGVTVRGDDLSSNQPLCALGLQPRFHCMFTCPPASHPTRYERVALWPANAAMAARAVHHWHGRFTAVTMVRYRNDVLRRRGDEALAVNGVASTVVNAKTGEPLSHNSWITNHRLTADNVVDGAQSGRGRWQIANENNHVLKTTGDHLEQNLGHGKQ